MVRIFRHYLSVKLLAIIALEAVVFALAIRLGLAFNHFSGLPREEAFSLFPIAMFVFGMVIVMSAVGLYSADGWTDLRSVRMRIVAVALLVLVLIFLMTLLPPSLVMEPFGFAITVAAVFLGVALVRFGFYRWDKLTTFKPRVLVLGTGSRVSEYAELAQRNHNYTIVGFVPVSPSEVHAVPPSLVMPLLPGDSLVALVKRHHIDQIVLAVRDRRGKLPVNDLVECKLHGVKVTELATAYEREYRQVSLETISASWVMLEEGFQQGAFRTGVKRLFDLCVSTLLLIVTLPVLVIAALCIVIESGFPILYRQERVGERGRVFAMYKLRSMRQDAEGDGTPRWAAAKDDRTTHVGRIIRKLRIDELPQLINVLKGDMSFVGPRPERPFFVEKLVKELPYYSLRHTIKPGITGWAQVCYPYGASLEDATEKLKYDLYYVKNHALFLDLVVLFATIEVVFTGKGAR